MIELFYEQLAKHYDVVFPLEQGKIAFLHEEFAARGARRILDLACGTGTYTLELASLGYEAYGTDLEPGMVDVAREKAAALKSEAKFAVGDMLEPQTLGIIFDGLLCIGNSLAHLSGIVDLTKALRAMRGVLRTGGVAIFQIVNFDRILSLGDTDLPLIERRGICFRRTYRPQSPERLIFESVLEVSRSDGSEDIFNNSVELRPIRKDELETVLYEAGFDAVRSYGDFKYGEYRQDSQAVVMAAEC
jgi:glycine/sarcosine N-methyltransferase